MDTLSGWLKLTHKSEWISIHIWHILSIPSKFARFHTFHITHHDNRNGKKLYFDLKNLLYRGGSHKNKDEIIFLRNHVIVITKTHSQSLSNRIIIDRKKRLWWKMCFHFVYQHFWRWSNLIEHVISALWILIRWRMSIIFDC